MRKAFMDKLVRLAEKDKQIVLLYGDVKQCMDEFESRWPERIFNMGIAEPSMVSIAAGMALEGLRPVVYTITPFLVKRSLEQIFLDVDQQKMPVILAGWDAGYETQGPTHSHEGIDQIAKSLPNTKFYSPQNPEQTAQYLVEAYNRGAPALFNLKRVQ